MLAASVTTGDPAGRHLVVFAAERVPPDLGERVARRGGSVDAALDSIASDTVATLGSRQTMNTKC
jgi:hypothetical protein